MNSFKNMQIIISYFMQCTNVKFDVGIPTLPDCYWHEGSMGLSLIQSLKIYIIINMITNLIIFLKIDNTVVF